MADAWSPERRRNERRDVPFPLYAQIIDSTAGAPAAEPLRVRVSGVSVGGLVLESATLLPVDLRVSLTLASPDTDIGPLKGRIVHSRLMLAPRGDAAPSYVAGLAFDGLDAAASQAIGTLLSSIGGQPAPHAPGHAP